MKWIRDNLTESFLKRIHVDFNWQPEYKRADIDMKESMDRQTRIAKKVDQDLALKYAIQMQRDDAVFKSIIVNHLPKAKLAWIVDGLHRGVAAELTNQETIGVYLVSVTDPRMLDFLPRASGALEGRERSTEEMLIHANYMQETYSMDTDEVCEWFALKPEQLQRFRRQEDVAKQISLAGVSVNGKLSKSMLVRLSPLTEDRNVLAETVRFMLKHEIVGDEGYRLIDDLKKQPTSVAKMAELDKWVQMMKSRDQKVKKKEVFHDPVRRQFFKLGHALLKLLDGRTSLTQLQIVHPTDVDQATKLSKRISQFLGNLVERTHVRN